MRVLVSDIVSAPYGMPTIRPDSHFVLIHFSIPFLKYVSECGEVPLNRVEVTLSDFVPLGFQRTLELQPKMLELFLCHRVLLWRDLAKPVPLCEPILCAGSTCGELVKTDSGVEAAETGESDAQGTPWSGAVDETVGVVHNVKATIQG